MLTKRPLTIVSGARGAQLPIQPGMRGARAKFYRLFTVVLALCAIGVMKLIAQALKSFKARKQRDPTFSAIRSGHNVFEMRVRHFETVVKKRQHTVTYRFCPCCGLILEDEKFSVFGAAKPPDRACPRCHAAERLRRVCTLLADTKRNVEDVGTPWLQPPTGLNRPFRLLSFGPHPQMEAEITVMPNVDHIGVDYFYPGYKYSNLTLHADVQKLSFPDGFADGIIILHVLEHVPDLQQALGELSRVLRNESGWAFIEVPCASSDGFSTKDCRLNTAKERLTCAGQHDHVWRFGCNDFALQLRQYFKKCDDISGTFGWLDSKVFEGIKINKVPLYLCRN